MPRDPIRNKIRRKRRKAQNDRARFLKKAGVAKRRIAGIQAWWHKVRARRKPGRLYDTIAFDGTPTFRILALVLLDCRRHGWSGVLNSSDRREGVAERFGKMSQAKLWDCSRNCRADCYGNCNPANPPWQGSHVLIGDGVVGKPGVALEKYELGLDTSEADELRATLGRLGYSAKRPYADSREQHHTNLTKDPRKRLIARGRL